MSAGTRTAPGRSTAADFRIRRDLRGAANAPSHDVFLIKMSHCLPM